MNNVELFNTKIKPDGSIEESFYAGVRNRFLDYEDNGANDVSNFDEEVETGDVMAALTTYPNGVLDFFVEADELKLAMDDSRYQEALAYAEAQLVENFGYCDIDIMRAAEAQYFFKNLGLFKRVMSPENFEPLVITVVSKNLSIILRLLKCDEDVVDHLKQNLSAESVDKIMENLPKFIFHIALRTRMGSFIILERSKHIEPFMEADTYRKLMYLVRVQERLILETPAIGKTMDAAIAEVGAEAFCRD